MDVRLLDFITFAGGHFRDDSHRAGRGNLAGGRRQRDQFIRQPDFCHRKRNVRRNGEFRELDFETEPLSYIARLVYAGELRTSRLRGFGHGKRTGNAHSRKHARCFGREGFQRLRGRFNLHGTFARDKRMPGASDLPNQPER